MKLRFINTTVQNRSKRNRLRSEHVIPLHHLDRPDVSKYLLEVEALEIPKEELLFSIGNCLLGESDNPAVREFLESYEYKIHKVPVPPNAFDLLGSVYQYLNSKHENLMKGSFYTGKAIAEDFVGDLEFQSGQVIFDPACGSGVFLFRSKASAEQVCGVDFDPVAVMIAKFNYFLKFPEAGPPNLFHADFFEWYSKNPKRKFDYIIGNPPYGASLDKSKIPSLFVSSGESFSYFIELASQLIADSGLLRFLVPESLLNVKRHADIRNYLLDQVNLVRIKRYPGKFSGVMSDVYLIEVNNGSSDSVEFRTDEVTQIPKPVLRQLKSQVFAHLNNVDVEILNKVSELGRLDLRSSTFGLGVVTGDNKTKIFSDPSEGTEPIFSGKEVSRYRLDPPRNHLVFERAKLQQVAPDAIYRAPQKLVYKVISKHLKFALDEGGALTTNSANILIPNLHGYTIHSAMALLNSDLYSFLHLKLFGGVNKVAKENLLALMFPIITASQNAHLTQLAKDAIGSTDHARINNYVNSELFQLERHEIAHIARSLKLS